MNDYWTSKKLRNKYPNANIYFVYGGRSAGKSFDSKSLTLDAAISSLSDHDNRFMLIRRFDSECTAPKLKNYYNNVKIWSADNDLNTFTDGKYNNVIPYHSSIYLGNGKDIDYDAQVGYYMALENEQDWAGASIEDVTTMVFEEAISRTKYLIDEPAKLMNMYCTIDRNRGKVKLWMFGNPLGKYIPYIVDWGLKPFIDKLEDGEMKALYIPVPDVNGEYPHGSDTKERVAAVYRKDYLQIAIEHTKSRSDGTKVIGKHADTLITGKWQVDNKPKLFHNYKNDKLVYRIIFELDTYRFIAEYRVNGYNRYWFIYPKRTSIKANSRVISTVPNTSIKYTVNLVGRTRTESELFSQFNKSNVFYCNDDCGTFFAQLALNFLGLKL